VTSRLLPLLATLFLLAAAPAAHAQLPSQGFSSDNVELVENIAIGPTSGARLLDGYFYITTGRDLQIYDTLADPEHPVKVGGVTYPVPDAEEQRAPHEDPDTNGRILVAGVGSDLLIYDVSVKTAPKLLATVPNAGEHTVSCILDCTYVYGSSGGVTDIRDPAHPKQLGNFFDALPVNSTHDVTEVAPGIVLTSSEPMRLLDVRADPLNPKPLAEAAPPGFMHASLWGHAMTDDMLLVGGEGSLNGCPGSADATFMTYDTRDWPTTRTFKLLSEFRMSAGTFSDGKAPQTTFCVHWFDTQPQFRDGGLVAIGWYESGLRFLKVGLDGAISEVGYWLPVGARTSAAYWRTDRILYTSDYYRGIDVLKFTGDIPPSRAETAVPAPAPAPPAAVKPARAVSVDDLVRLPSARRCVRGGTLTIRVRKAQDAVTSVRVFVKGRRVLTARGRALRTPLRIRRLPRGRSSVQVVVRTRSGHQTAAQRTYRRC